MIGTSNINAAVSLASPPLPRVPELAPADRVHTLAVGDDRAAVWTCLAAWFGLSALVFNATAGARVADLDMFHDMTLFRVALAIDWIPQYDVFAYIPSVSPSVHHE